MSITDDDLRRIARRINESQCDRITDSRGCERYYSRSTAIGRVASESDSDIAAILREELEKLFTSVTAFDLVHDDPLTTVVHTTDD